MNVSDLENELRALRPASPSAHLRKAIEQELSGSPLAITAPTSLAARAGVIERVPESRWSALLTGLCWAASGAAVAVLVLLNYPGALPQGGAAAHPGATARADAAFESTESSSELLGEETSDIFYTSNREPARAVRYNSVERHVWANRTTGARLEVEVPREDLVLVPVSFQ